MSLPRTVADVLNEHMALEVECIDRMSLNVSQPQLQYDCGVVNFFRFHRGHTFASSALMQPISQAFIDNVERFVKRRNVPLITFRKGERKEDIVLPYRLAVKGRERRAVLLESQTDATDRGRLVGQQDRSVAAESDNKIEALLRKWQAILPQPFAAQDVAAGYHYGTTPDSLTSGQMTYQLRRLRLHGLIQRILKTHRYQLTASGAITTDKYTTIHNRVLRPELATLTNSTPSVKT